MLILVIRIIEYTVAQIYVPRKLKKSKAANAGVQLQRSPAIQYQNLTGDK
jgi:hypothetical protein